MIAFVIQRLLQSVLVLAAVALVAFALFAYVGDPVTTMLGQNYSLAAREELVRALGLDRPFYVQFANFVAAAAHGEFGLSYRLARPVSALILERLPATLELSVVAAALALACGIPMGVYAGLRRNSWLARLFMVVSLIGVSLPTFLVGILLILVFSVMIAKAITAPSCRPATVITGTSVFLSAWPKWTARSVRPRARANLM